MPQVTAVLLLPVSCAENCTACDAVITAVAGVIETVTGLAPPALIAPAATASEKDVPFGDAASALGMAIGIDPCAEEESVILTLATVPARIALWFRPVNKQVDEPFPPAHVTDLPAAAPAGPALTVTAEITAAP